MTPRDAAGPTGSNRAVAGWYPDPKLAGTQRFWDGAQWTEDIAPLANVPTSRRGQPAGPAKMFLAFILICACIAGIAWFQSYQRQERIGQEVDCYMGRC